MSDSSPSPSPSPRKHRAPKKDAALLAALTPDMIAVGGDESVNVAIRVRPFNRREMEIHRQQNPDEYIRSVIEMPDGITGTVRVLDRDPQTGEFKENEVFHFTKSFWSIPEEQQPSKFLPITQEDVFECVGKVVLMNAFGGFNSCVFAYGQTGSGKTHTMMGDFHTVNGNFSGDPGIIPRLCRSLFEQIEVKKQELEAADPRLKVDFDVKLSALEIYNEQVRDLFWKGSTFQGRTKNTILKVRVHPTDGAFVDQLTVLNPKNWEQCIKLIASGVSERTVAATLMNDESSRSHSVFQITVVQSDSLGPPPEDPSRRYEKPVVTTKSSKVNLVDLAGSERNKKSGVQGQQLREAAGINQSLSTLKKVIDALVTNSTEKNPKKHVLVPYRESMLTQLLSHSLGGNSKTTMITCVSPHYDNLEETLNSLRYANRAKGIVNHVKVNEDNAQKQAMILRDQIAALQAKLAEGPQEFSPQQLDELRDQIAIGEREMEERRRQAELAEKEARRIQEELKSQKDARYAATYYNSFKRMWLQRQRNICEDRKRGLEAKLNRLQADNERTTNTIGQRDMFNTDARYKIDEHNRRKDHGEFKSVRTEAMTRQMRRDIQKAERRIEENITARWGTIMLRKHQEKKLRNELKSREEDMKREHEQYLQSIQKEAKRQYQSLVDNYADREAAQTERLERCERTMNHAQSTLEKAEQHQLSLQLSLERSIGDHAKREVQKEQGWERRYQQMKQMYEEKVREMRQRRLTEEEQWQSRLESTRRKALTTHAERIEELEIKLQQVDIDGQRRLDEVQADAQTQAAELVQQTVIDRDRSIAELQGQFEEDAGRLGQRISEAMGRLTSKRQALDELTRYALDVEDAGRRAESALQRTSGQQGPADYILHRRQLERFLHQFRNANFEFHRVSATLKKPIPPAPDVKA